MTEPPSPASLDSAPAQLDELGSSAGQDGGARIDTLLDMMLPVTIEFGRTSMTVQEVLNLGPGSVIQLDRVVGEPIDIYVNERRLAEGEVVVIGDTFGIRVTKVLNVPRENSPRQAGR